MVSMNMIDSLVDIDKSKMNERVPSRNGRVPSRTGEKRIKGETVTEAVAAVLNQNGKIPHEKDGIGRYNTIKKIADEQRRRVREIRERHMEEEKLTQLIKKNEEIRVQVRTALDGMLKDVRQDMNDFLDKRIEEEKRNLEESMKSELESRKATIAAEVKRQLSNGESFDARLARMKQEFENSFKSIAKDEYNQIENQLFSFLEKHLETEKTKWENAFKRDGIKRIKAAEGAVKADFRVGLEDSQKQCSEIMSSMQERSASLEQKVTNRIAVMDAENASVVQDTERLTCQFILDKLDERDRLMKDIFNDKAEKLQKEVKKVHKEATTTKSFFCILL